MAESIYVGYANQLRQAADELRSRASVLPSAPSRSLVINIEGPPKAGKRTFVRRLWENLEKGEIPRILFTLDPSDTEKIAENFLAEAKTNRSYLEDAIVEISSDFQEQIQHLENAGKSLPGESRLTVFAELVEQNLVENISVNRDLQIIFALPDFLTLAQNWRDALSRQIHRGTDKVDCRIILTTPALELREDVIKQFPDRMPILDIQLPPLMLEEVEQWLIGRQLSMELTAEVYNRFGGLPGNLEHVALEVIHEREEKLLAALAENALHDLQANEKTLLCLAAMLPEINERTLLVTMKEPEARLVMERLRALDLPDSEWKADKFVLGQKIQHALVKYLEKHDSQVYRKALPQTEQFVRICEIIPSSQHREMLARLSVFNYFNEALLRELSPTTADELVRLIVENPAYFENSGSNFKLKNEVRQIIENYIKITGFVIPGEDRAKIASAWEARRKKIMEAMTLSELKIKKDSDALSTLQTQIKQTSSGIDKELDRINRFKRSAQRKDNEHSKNQDSDTKLQISRIAMLVVGFTILYLSLLFYTKTSLIYAAVGFGLMIGALFVRSNILVKAKVSNTVASPPNPSEVEAYNKNLHFMNIKKSQLESKQNIMALSIAREKTALKEFDKQLREPYS